MTTKEARASGCGATSRPLGCGGGGRRHHRRRRVARGERRGADVPSVSSRATSPAGRRAARRSWCTAGLRYLAQGDREVDLASVRERDRLLAELARAGRAGRVPARRLRRATGWGRRALGFGLTIYDWLGRGAAAPAPQGGTISRFWPHGCNLENLAGASGTATRAPTTPRLVLRTLLEALARRRRGAQPSAGGGSHHARRGRSLAWWCAISRRARWRGSRRRWW